MMILDVFLLRDDPYRHACESSRAPLWMMVFLLGTGAVYGSLVAWFQRTLGGEIQGVALERIPDALLYAGNVVSGILVALVFHGGVTLLVWLMARAVGGPGRLGALYRASAYLLPLTLLALPYLAADSAAGARDFATLPLAALYRPLAWLSALWLLPGLYRLVRVTQGTSAGRSLFAVALFALFCSSILLVL